LRSDPEFAAELNFQLDLKKAVRSKERQELRQVLEMTEHEMTGQTKVKRVFTHHRLLIWAGAAAILILIFFIWFIPGTPALDAGALFTEFYEPYANTVSPVTKSGQEDLDGYQAYELKRYDRAISLLARQMPNDTAAFYLALSFLGNQQKDDAKLILQQLVDSNSSYFVPALWYLSLMLIEQAKYKEAEDLLVQVSASDHPLATRAKLLLTKLL
jgi:tetratricopeptide (TPR) repeat protein